MLDDDDDDVGDDDDDDDDVDDDGVKSVLMPLVTQLMIVSSFYIDFLLYNKQHEILWCECEIDMTASRREEGKEKKQCRTLFHSRYSFSYFVVLISIFSLSFGSCNVIQIMREKGHKMVHFLIVFVILPKYLSNRKSTEPAFVLKW